MELSNKFTAMNGKIKLMQAALPLVVFMAHCKQKKIKKTKEEVVNYLIDELRHFQKKSETYFSQKIILAARYCICAVLDEFISLNTWGREVNWAQHSLLHTLHNETWGGERFFIILDAMLINEEENLEILELIYIFLCLGYEGKYYISGLDELKKIKNKLYDLVQKNQCKEIFTEEKPILQINNKRTIIVLISFSLLVFSITNLISFEYSKPLITLITSHSF